MNSDVSTRSLEFIENDLWSLEELKELKNLMPDITSKDFPEKSLWLLKKLKDSKNLNLKDFVTIQPC
jgi:hypothetical protein